MRDAGHVARTPVSYRTPQLALRKTNYFGPSRMKRSPCIASSAIFWIGQGCAKVSSWL
jgi:hypothetical protein